MINLPFTSCFLRFATLVLLWLASVAGSQCAVAQQKQVNVQVLVDDDHIQVCDPLVVKVVVSNPTNNSVGLPVGLTQHWSMSAYIRTPRAKMDERIEASFDTGCDFGAIDVSDNDMVTIPAGKHFVGYFLVFLSGSDTFLFDSAGSYRLYVKCLLRNQVITSPPIEITVKTAESPQTVRELSQHSTFLATSLYFPKPYALDEARIRKMSDIAYSLPESQLRSALVDRVAVLSHVQGYGDKTELRTLLERATTKSDIERESCFLFVGHAMGETTNATGAEEVVIQLKEPSQLRLDLVD
jgi:hypothetical protein